MGKKVVLVGLGRESRSWEIGEGLVVVMTGCICGLLFYELLRSTYHGHLGYHGVERPLWHWYNDHGYCHIW